MDKFDEKIIGYESTKNILRQILDTLKRPELYKSKGASIPRGLLMESDPGLGKSLLATVFIKESGRKSLVFRKTSQENSFLDELRAAFLAAKEAAPSILLLEDLNLYVESNSPYAPESITAQGIFGGPSGIIVSVGVGIIFVTYTIADTVHQRNYSEKLRVYMIEKCKPIFA